MGKYKGYNDAWIQQNVSNHPSWKKLFDAYFDEFGFGNYRNFRNHLYKDLGMTRLFTEEQNEWIKANYPSLGAEHATAEFCKLFNVGRSIRTISVQAFKLGVNVNKDVTSALRKQNTQKRPIGCKAVRKNTTHKRGVRRDTVYVKAEDGTWKRESEINFGRLTKGKRIIHLNGNTHDNSKRNLEAVDMKTLAKMTAYKLWSEDPIITKTGIMCCDLENIIGKKGEKTQ